MSSNSISRILMAELFFIMIDIMNYHFIDKIVFLQFQFVIVNNNKNSFVVQILK